LTYKSDSDVLELSHQALNRTVFATGALLAAEFIKLEKPEFTGWMTFWNLNPVTDVQDL
jgi:dihydrodipicolinate reductase